MTLPKAILPILDAEDGMFKASYLEKYIIPVSDWGNPEVPEGIRQCAEISSKEGIPSAIAHHMEFGWFVLQCGQGPYIAWTEEDGDYNYKPPAEPVPEGGLFILQFGEEPKAWTEGTGDI